MFSLHDSCEILIDFSKAHSNIFQKIYFKKYFKLLCPSGICVDFGNTAYKENFKN